MPRIWTRLFLLTLLAVVLTWLVIGLAIQALQQAERAVIELDTVHLPAVSQTSQLSAQIADLAILSNELLVARSVSETQIDIATDDLSRFLQSRLESSPLVAETEKIVRELDVIAQTMAQMRAIETSLIEEVSQLRWISLELEEETSAHVADFSFNIQAQTRNIVVEETRAEREVKSAFLAEEMRRRNAFADLSTELTTLVSVSLQVASSEDTTQLDQLRDIQADRAARVNAVLSQVSAGSDFLTIRQSVEALDALSDRLTALRRDWISQRDQLQIRLERALRILSEIQREMQSAGTTQRLAMSETITEFSSRSYQRRSVLLGSTVLALLGGLSILFLYIRPAIIRPMQNLTQSMNAIAEGKVVDFPNMESRNDEIGQLTHAVHAFSTSVKDRDAAIRKLQTTQSELVQAGKMAALGNLSAGIGHELNQPLGAIKQRMHILRAAIRNEDREGQERQAQKIDDLANRMEKTIQHLKKFARRSEYQQEEVAILPLLRSATDLMKGNLAERDISISIDPSLDGIVFLGDAILIEQVVINLFSNASDAIFELKKPGIIEVVAAEAAPDYIAFSVLDNGAGLGEYDPENLIEPFVTSKDPGAGLGLGLSISFNILQGLGGDLEIEQRVQGGVCATVTLPKSDELP